MKATDRASPSIGIDIGGTFTDFVVFDPATGRLSALKVLSTPADPAEAVLEGMRRLTPPAGQDAIDGSTIIHGSTVATNALLERKGARTAFVTTRGFRDVLRIGRQTRRRLYDWFSDGVPALVPRERCLEVPERLDHHGRVVTPLELSSLPALLRALREERVEAVAVCLLFAFVNPEHERRVGEYFREAGLCVTMSHELIPEFREFERASTTVVNAYVSPALDRYLGVLERAFAGNAFHIMQSNGGRIRVAQARREGVRSLLSGPAGGVVGAASVGKRAGCSNLITFDMGGTSTDVAVVNGGLRVTSEAEVGGMPIRVPMLDIHTVGAGGGSLARVDAGGALRVGPESAGADPGPACYGRGGRMPTVTDAHAVLGRMPSTGLLGGAMPLDVEAAHRAMEDLARALGGDAGSAEGREEAALGVIQVVNAGMERAIRVISVERGYDPREYVLLSFGGAGGLHACELARALMIGRVLVPQAASTLSALGMVTADVSLDYVRTVMSSGDLPCEELERRFAPLVARARDDLATQRIAPDAQRVHCELDVRYRGQSFDLTVPFSPAFCEAFHASHARRYGYRNDEADLEIVNLRVRATGDVPPLRMEAQPPGPADVSGVERETRHLVLPSGRRAVPVFDRRNLHPGHHVPGPAMIVQDDTTTLVPESDEARVDAWHNLLITIGDADA